MRATGGAPSEVAVPLGDFGLEALRGTAGESASLEAVTRQALYYYLASRDDERPGWRYPRFLRDAGDPDVSDVVLALRVDDAAWARFAAEADAQQVSPELLLRHAVLYFAADVEAGRVARRLLDELS